MKQPTLFLITLAMSTSAASAQTPTFDGLGYLPNQVSPWSECTGVSADGETIVGFARQEGHSWAMEPFIWTASRGMIGLGAPPIPGSGTPAASAYAISANGEVAVGTTDFGLPDDGAFSWSRTTAFAPLESLRGSTRSEAFAVSADGRVVAGQSKFSSGYVGLSSRHQATVWRDGVEQGLGAFPAGPISKALGVSGNGRVVVGEALRDDEEGQTAFRWTAEEGLVSLGDLPGGWHFSRASAASHDGTTIVGMGTVSFSGASFSVDSRACKWTSTGVEELPLPPGTYLSEALAVSSDGAVAVGWARAPGDHHAAIWSPADGGRDIIQVMTNAGIDMSDWFMTIATGVSDDGHVVVGHGYRHSTGAVEAWRAWIP